MLYIKIIILVIAFIILSKVERELMYLIINNKKGQIKKSIIKNVACFIIFYLMCYSVVIDKRLVIQSVGPLLEFYVIDGIIFFTQKKNIEKKDNNTLNNQLKKFSSFLELL